MIFKQKDQPKHLQELTGSPSPTAVSDVAKGGKPQTLNEFDDAYHTMSSSVKVGHTSEMPEEQPMPHKPGMVKPGNCDDIEEAYAMLFEGLAMIARSHSKEESEEPIDNDD